jgi:hypothetical protein
MDITLRSHKRAGVGINAQGGGGVVEALTCPTRDGQGADAVAMPNVASAAGTSFEHLVERRLRGVPDGIERSIGTIRRPGEYRALILMSPTKSPASVAIIRIVERAW